MVTERPPTCVAFEPFVQLYLFFFSLLLLVFHPTFSTTVSRIISSVRRSTFFGRILITSPIITNFDSTTSKLCMYHSLLLRLSSLSLAIGPLE